MAQHERQEIEFLGEDGEALTPDELDAVGGSERAYRRRARVEQYLPEGGGAAIASLVFVLVTWLGANPLVQAVTTVFPQSMHTVGDLGGGSFGGQYYGVSPGTVPVISFGVRALIALLAVVLALRARHREHSTLATAAVASASLTLLLMLAAGAVMVVGLALHHSAGNFGSPF